jgi:AcrR family transcriptional regulator
MTNLWSKSVESHKKHVEGRVIEVALDLIAEKGMSEVSMSELAKRAGVSRQTLYNAFPDLAHVVIAWMESEIDRHHQQLNRGLAELSDPVERLSFYIRSSLRACVERRHHAGVEAAMSAEAAMSEETWQRISEQLSKMEVPLRGILSSGVREGKFRSDIDINTLTRLIFHLTGSLHHVTGAEDRDPEKMGDAIMDLVMNGIGT